MRGHTTPIVIGELTCSLRNSVTRFRNFSSIAAVCNAVLHATMRCGAAFFASCRAVKWPRSNRIATTSAPSAHTAATIVGQLGALAGNAACCANDTAAGPPAFTDGPVAADAATDAAGDAHNDEASQLSPGISNAPTTPRLQTW